MRTSATPCAWPIDGWRRQHAITGGAGSRPTCSSYFGNINNGYFDNASMVGGVGEWMSDAVQLTATHFFGGNSEEEGGTPTTMSSGGD